VEPVSLLLIAVGLVLLAGGAELLVRGAAGLAARLGISPLVVGLTVVAFATSAPELAVTVVAAVEGTGDLALGNVVGSNVFNVLAILGVSALVAPLAVDPKLLRLDIPLMIAVSVVAGLLALDGRVGRVDGALLLAGLIAYVALSVRLERRRMSAPIPEAPGGNGGVDDAAPGNLPEAVVSPPVAPAVGWHPAWMVVAVFAGLGLLVLGSHWLVTGAVAVARALDVSERVIGLTLVAAGTSLPELATSVVASFRGERDIAVGNIVGSNLFNLLCVLGTAAAILPVPVASAAMRMDIPVMIAAAAVCLPIALTDRRISRVEGGVLLASFAGYLAWIVLAGPGG
jgi:cation:H+ antiporter